MGEMRREDVEEEEGKRKRRSFALDSRCSAPPADVAKAHAASIHEQSGVQALGCVGFGGVFQKYLRAIFVSQEVRPTTDQINKIKASHHYSPP